MFFILKALLIFFLKASNTMILIACKTVNSAVEGASNVLQKQRLIVVLQQILEKPALLPDTPGQTYFRTASVAGFPQTTE
jgi:hypothetical protein